jgi:hypothetical protein
MRTRTGLYRPAAVHRRTATLIAALLICAFLAPCAGRTETPGSVEPISTKIHQFWTDIDRQTDKIAKTLSPAAREAIQRSLLRFHQWAAGYCGVSDSREGLSAGDVSCVKGHYVNFLTHIPQSVYSIGTWTVYETSVYGLLWADDDLLGQDPTRPFTWDLQVTWPHVDAAPSPLSWKMNGALKDKVYSFISGWAVGGWEDDVTVHIETINACYASVGIHQYIYGGGAHGNDIFQSFNWNQMSDAPLSLAELFKPGIDWRHAIMTLYKKHLQSGDDTAPAASIPDEAFPDAWITRNTIVTDRGLQIVVDVSSPRDAVPDVELTWAELQPWLAPSAPCTSVGPPPASP